MIKVNGTRLAALRNQRGISVKQLAEKSGVSKRTIERLESTSSHAQESNVHALEDSLEVARDEIVIDDFFVSETSTDVERVALEERARRDAARASRRSDLPELDATTLVELLTASAVHADAVYSLRGEIESHRPITHFEAAVLGAELADTARLLFAIPMGKDRVVHATVHTRDVATTAALLEAWRACIPARVRVRVAVPRTNGRQVCIERYGTGAELEEDVKWWRGFVKLAPREPQPFALVVESVEPPGAE